MRKKITRRTFIKRTLGSFITAIGGTSALVVYAEKIEPDWLEINNIKIVHHNIPTAFHQFKIVHFSDTHIGFQYSLDQLKNLVDKINRLEPNLLFFTGDLLDEPNQFKEIESVTKILKQLKSSHGKFSVYGNHDHGGYGTDIYKYIMKHADFQLLVNASKKIQIDGNDPLYIVGIDDAMLGLPEMKTALKGIPEDAFKILLSHAPDLADTASKYNIQLQLSGHSHGGQIKIPFLGALVVPPFGEKYIEGLYTIGNEAPLTLYVNRGLGTTRLPFRFLSKPELTVYTLLKED